MKKVESLTDKKIKEELTLSKKYILENEKLSAFLQKKFDSLSSAYILGHTPDQGEDFYTLLINTSTILTFELSRTDSDAIPENVNFISIDEYRKSLRGRQDIARLTLAIELTTAQENINLS